MKASLVFGASIVLVVLVACAAGVTILVLGWLSFFAWTCCCDSVWSSWGCGLVLVAHGFRTLVVLFGYVLGCVD